MGDVIGDWPRRRVVAMLRIGRRHGLTDAELLAGACGPVLVGDPEHLVTTDDEYRVVRNLVERVEPEAPIALEAGLDFDLLSFGSVGQIARTAADVSAMVSDMVSISGAVTTMIRIQPVLDGEHIVMKVDVSHLPPDIRQFLTVRNLVHTKLAAEEVLGRSLEFDGGDVAITGPRPPWADELEKFWGAPVQWEADPPQMRIRRSWLHEPLPAADARAHSRALVRMRQAIDEHRARAGFLERVRDELAGLPHGPVSAGDLAGRLDVSERTLRRNLAQNGTTFRDLLSDDRRTRAQQLLSSGHSIDLVSDLLGYSESAAFSRAFKRWTGVTPDIWRRSG